MNNYFCFDNNHLGLANKDKCCFAILEALQESLKPIRENYYCTKDVCVYIFSLFYAKFI